MTAEDQQELAVTWPSLLDASSASCCADVKGHTAAAALSAAAYEFVAFW